MQSLFALSGGDVRRSFPGSVGTGRFRAGGTYALLYCWRCRRSGPELLLCPGGAACFPGGRGNFYGWHGPGAGFDAGADPQRGLSFRDAFSQGSYGCDSFPGGKWIHGTGADVESDVPSDPSQAFEYDDSGFDGSRAGAFDGFPCDLGQDGALRGRGVVPDRDRGEEAFLLGRLPRGGSFLPL